MGKGVELKSNWVAFQGVSRGGEQRSVRNREFLRSKATLTIIEGFDRDKQNGGLRATVSCWDGRAMPPLAVARA